MSEAKLSWKSRIIHLYLRASRYKKPFESADAMRVRIRHLKEQPESHLPSRLDDEVTATEEQFQGWPVYRVMPKGSAMVHRHVVYLHGGGYFQEVAVRHWSLAAQVARDTPACCWVPVYPVVPRGGLAEVIVPTLVEFLRQLVAEVGATNVVLMGDSAGGGMAMAAAQQLRDGGFDQPHSIVLLSPWLDASFGSDEQLALGKRDLVLDVPGLIEAARTYAGNLGVTHPFVSPLRGSLAGLPPLTVVSGTADVLHNDSRVLEIMGNKEGVSVDLHVKAGLPHNFALFPTAEGRKARAIIVRAIAQ